VAYGSTTNCTTRSGQWVLGAFLLGRIWSPIELSFCDCVRGIGILHNKPIAAERVLFGKRWHVWGGRDSAEMALAALRRKERCDKVAVSIISCGWSGCVTQARERTRLQDLTTGLWEDMDFNRILFGVRGDCHLSDCKGSNTKTSPPTFRLIWATTLELLH
jgi:hypothetical protein